MTGIFYYYAPQAVFELLYRRSPWELHGRKELWEVQVWANDLHIQVQKFLPRFSPAQEHAVSVHRFEVLFEYAKMGLVVLWLSFAEGHRYIPGITNHAVH